MKSFPVKSLIAGIVVGLMAAPAMAEQYSCTLGELERVIEVSYDDAETKLPCEVSYKKEDGSVKSLWRAQNQQGYCEAKAQAFADKLSGWGWTCRQAEETETE